MHKNIKTYICLKIRRLYKPIITFFQKIGVSRFFKWIKKHQKLTVYIGSSFITFQLFLVRCENKELNDYNKKLEISNEVLRRDMSFRNSSMESFDWPWYKKVKRGNNFIITGMNQAYEDMFGLDKLKSLGKTNYDLVPYEMAKFFNNVDSIVSVTGQPKDTIEPWIRKDSTRFRLYTHKWSSIEINDTIIQGVSVPLARFIGVIDNAGRLEVIEIIPGNSSNSVKDTLFRKK